MAFYILHSSVLPLDLDIALWSALTSSDQLWSTLMWCHPPCCYRPVLVISPVLNLLPSTGCCMIQCISSWIHRCCLFRSAYTSHATSASHASHVTVDDQQWRRDLHANLLDRAEWPARVDESPLGLLQPRRSCSDLICAAQLPSVTGPCHASWERPSITRKVQARVQGVSRQVGSISHTPSLRERVAEHCERSVPHGPLDSIAVCPPRKSPACSGTCRTCNARL